MEDYHHVETEFDARAGEADSGSSSAFVAVYDGHGGYRAGEYLKQYLHRNVKKEVNFDGEPSAAGWFENVTEQIIRAFNITDLHFLEWADRDNLRDGSTATTVVLLDDTVLCCNVGDSRTVLCRDGGAKALSEDHKPDLPRERNRIEALGGSVRWYGCYRVEGDLAVSRAFGDKDLKKYVPSDPDLRKEKLQKGDEFIVLASDGLWDVMSNQEVVDHVKKHSKKGTNMTSAAHALVVEAYNRNSTDNITCVVFDVKRWLSKTRSGGD